MRNISFSMTTPQMLDGTKDVTRRMGWIHVQPGELLRAIEKGQGLKKGEKVVPLAIVQIVDARVERLDRMLTDREYGLAEVRREGFPDWTPEQFVEFFCEGHTGCFPERDVTRLEFRKLPLVREEFALHLRSSYGSTMGYKLVDETGAEIGGKSVFTPRARYREKHPFRTVLTLYDPAGKDHREFETGVDFLVAYQARLDARKEQKP